MMTNGELLQNCKIDGKAKLKHRCSIRFNDFQQKFQSFYGEVFRLHRDHNRVCHDTYIMHTGGWGDDRVLKDVYRHALEDTKKKMSNVAISYFEGMQHEIQHENRKTP